MGAAQSTTEPSGRLGRLKIFRSSKDWWPPQALMCSSEDGTGNELGAGTGSGGLPMASHALCMVHGEFASQLTTVSAGGCHEWHHQQSTQLTFLSFCSSVAVQN